MTDNLFYKNNYLNEKNNNIITSQKTNQILQNKTLNKIKVDDQNDFLDDIIKNSNINNITNYEQKLKYNIVRINIDSRNRNIIPKNITDNNIFYLEKNSLSFTKDSNILKIKTNKIHSLKIDDTIILQNVINNTINLKGGIILKKDNTYIKINHNNHGFTKYDLTYADQKIKISGVKGNSRNNSYINNIPVSLINTLHKIYLISDYDLIGSENYYYIKLDKKSNSDYTDSTSNIFIYMQNLCGIPLNQINANYPININQINGNQIVSNILDNYTFEIKLEINASKTNLTTGNSGIYFSKIVNYEEGYPKPNFYKIYIKKSLNNVRKLKIISSEFPNTEKVIKNKPANKANNKLYWQILDDGDHIYSIEITPGNYTPEGLSNKIRDKIDEIKRISFSDQLIINDGTNAKLEKGEFNRSTVSINLFTDIVEIKLYNLVVIEKCISVYDKSFEDGHKRLSINHVDHNLEKDDIIIIENAVATQLIPSTVINTSHTIEEIIDDNNYIIKLPIHNESRTSDNTRGGSAVNILIPLKFRMFFNYSDTIGKLLGFRHVGEENAITNFSTKVANNIAYENDFFQDTVGNDIDFDSTTQIVDNNVVQLSGDNYILMTCNIFKNNESLSSNSINNIFSKILLSDSPGKILFNQHIQLSEELSSPIKTLSEIEFKFFSPDGELFDFNGIDHSFTLEIYEEDTEHNKSQINSRTGINKNI